MRGLVKNRICTGQSKVLDKSSEITAIPEVLENIDITDATVSIDATGTQTKIAEQTVTGGCHYFLSIKENQRELPENVECTFRTHAGYDRYESVEKDHGRIESR
jgi:predicted transposase YbfD/YdcC